MLACTHATLLVSCLQRTARQAQDVGGANARAALPAPPGSHVCCHLYSCLRCARPPQMPGTPGVYAVYDSTGDLQYVGISRKVAVSMATHAEALPEQLVFAAKVRWQGEDGGSRGNDVEERPPAMCSRGGRSLRRLRCPHALPPHHPCRRRPPCCRCLSCPTRARTSCRRRGSSGCRRRWRRLGPSLPETPRARPCGSSAGGWGQACRGGCALPCVAGEAPVAVLPAVRAANTHLQRVPSTSASESCIMRIHIAAAAVPGTAGLRPATTRLVPHCPPSAPSPTPSTSAPPAVPAGPAQASPRSS